MTSIFGVFHPYGLAIGVGVVLGLWAVARMSRRFKVDPVWLEQALPFIFVGALLGARIYHLLTDWQLYRGATWIDLISVWKGGLGFFGAIFGGLIGLCLWLRLSRLKMIDIFKYLDLLAFGVPVAQIVGRLGNFVNQELYGLPTDLPWAIVVHGVRYHPLFIYEGLANIFIFILLWGMGWRKSFVLGKGQYAALYLFGYAFIRFWLEFLRLETAHWDGSLGFLSIAQWLCLGLMCLASVLFWTRRHACPAKGGGPGKFLDFSLD